MHPAAVRPYGAWCSSEAPWQASPSASRSKNEGGQGPGASEKSRVSSVGSLGLAAFLIVFALAQALPSNLPTGSYFQRFDRTVWLDPHSSDYVKDDISPRQKMLADVIATLPGVRSQKEDEILGPSLDTGYFKNTGRDLIYVYSETLL